MVDILTWIALMCFIRNNNPILFQQMNKEYWCIGVLKDSSFFKCHYLQNIYVSSLLGMAVTNPIALQNKCG